MSDGDVHLDEMFGDDPQLAAFAQHVRDAAAAAPLPALGDELTLVLAEGLPGIADGSSLTPTPAPRRTRSRWVRAAVAGAVAGITFGGLGVAGALPDSVQERVSRVADVVGVNLPTPALEAPPVPPVELPAPAVTNVSPRVQAPVFDAEDGDDAGTDDAPAPESVPVEDDAPGRSDDRGPRPDDRDDDPAGPEADDGDADADGDTDDDTDVDADVRGDEDDGEADEDVEIEANDGKGSDEDDESEESDELDRDDEDDALGGRRQLSSYDGD